MKKYLLMFGAFLCLTPNCMAMTFDEYFNQISNDGKVELNAIKPKTRDEAEGIINYTVDTMYSNDEFRVTGFCDENLTDCYIGLSKNEEVPEGEESYKSYEVEYIYKKYDQDVYDKVQGYVKKFPQYGAEYVEGLEHNLLRLDDLELINYIINTSAKQENMSMENLNAVINYSRELKELLEGSNINAYLDTRAGWEHDFSAGAFGYLTLTYNNFAYSSINYQGVKQNRVLYIPSDTKNTTEAFIAAAKKRLDDYIGENNIKITYGGQIADIDTTSLDIIGLDEIVNVDNTIGEYYIFNFDGDELKFFIEKNDDRIKEVNLYTTDMKSDASISSYSPYVPLDSKIMFNFFDKASSDFKNLMEKLNLKFGVSMDIKLHSNSKKQFITKLENGEFKVYIPLTDEMKNLELVSYYLKEDGSIEEHPVTIENGYAIFTTNHFSTYTLGVKNDNISNPNTYDEIDNYLIIGGLSLLTILGSITIVKKKGLFEI